MKKNWILIFLTYILLSCSSLPVEFGSLDKYQHTPNEAFVILGVIGDESIGSVTHKGLSNLIVMGTENKKVQAYRVELNKEFQVIKAYYLISHQYGYVRYIPIKGPTLTPSSPGMYYYGTIYTKEGKSWFKNEPDPEVIDLLKKTYPQLIGNLSPRNFKLN